MSFPKPEYSKNQVNKAGRILRDDGPPTQDTEWALDVLHNWRSCHSYPINTFQATLRNKLRELDRSALVAQRLKRFPSIIGKLRRYRTMELARMQDIGGLRAVLASVGRVRHLEKNYVNSQFKHELVDSKDYISRPKASGYRSIHLVYKYRNPGAPDYDGLLLELQLRSRLQHAWATAVETMGTFLDRALKSSEGPESWLSFFALTGTAFAHLERTPPAPPYDEWSIQDVYRAVLQQSLQLRIREQLSAFRVATERITSDKGRGRYHLITLNMQERRLNIRSFSDASLDAATDAYSEQERRIADGEPLQAVLVSAGDLDNLRRAYPNYFLDTDEFIRQLNRIESTVTRGR